MRRVAAALGVIATATLLASAAAYLNYFDDSPGVLGAGLLLLALFVSPVAVGGLLAILLTWKRRSRVIDMLIALPGVSCSALLCTLPLIWEEWDYFRRTPAPAFGWELAPLGVAFLSLLPLVLAVPGYVVGLVVGTRAGGARILRPGAGWSIYPASGVRERARWLHSATVAGLSSLVIGLDIVVLPHVYGPLGPPTLPPEPPAACLSTAAIDETRAFHGDPRLVAPLPADLGPDWDPYTNNLDEIGFGAYSATYRLGDPTTTGVLLRFKVRIFGDVAGAADEYCRREHPRDATDFPIADGMFVWPVPYGTVAVGRAGNVIIEISTSNRSDDSAGQVLYVEAAVQAFAQRFQMQSSSAGNLTK